MTLGTRLRQARINKGYRLRKAQAMSGVSFSTIFKAERDVGEIGSQTLEKLAKCYGVTMDSLMLDNAPSFRADATTVRRAVLLADLEAMRDALETGSAEEREIAYALNAVLVATRHGYTVEMYHEIKPLVTRWLAGSAQRPKGLPGSDVDAGRWGGG